MASRNRKNIRLATYLPMMISQSRTGEVSSSSMVPSFASSAIMRMVSVGASRMKMTTVHWKNGLRVASGNGSPKSRVKKNPVSARKISPTMYAVGLRKNI